MKSARQTSRGRAWAFVIALALLACPAACRAGMETTEDTEETQQVDSERAITITLPAAAPAAAAAREGAAEVPYRLEVNFLGDAEQTLVIYEWSPPDNDHADGIWLRRIFFNNYYQGKHTVAEVRLPAGRRLMIIAVNKSAMPPAGRLSHWTQMSPAGQTIVPAGASRPHITAAWDGGNQVATNLVLRPIAPERAGGGGAQIAK